MSGAAIHDLGYRSFDGARAGVGAAMTALGIHAVQRVLGLKRAARHKVLPLLTILLSFVPALVFVGMAAFLPTDLLEDDLLPTYGEYYGFIIVIIWMFAAFVAPEAICTDRRTGMLSLYLASPLNRTTYIVSKVGAVAATMLAITLLPSTFLLVAYTIEGAGPSSVGSFVELFARITVVGLLIAVYFAAFSAMISSLTSRRAVASATTVIVFMMAGVISSALIEGADFDDRIALLQVAALPLRSAVYLLGERLEGDTGLSVVDGALALAVTVAVAVAASAVTWWRYQRIEVER